MHPKASVTVIIVSWNTRELLEKALTSIPDVDPSIDLQILVIDNGSQDGSQQMVRSRFPEITLIEESTNLGFSGANNVAAVQARGEFLLLLNSDAELKPGALEAMLDFMVARPEAGAVGPRILNTDGSLQSAYMDFPNLWREFLILSGAGRYVLGKSYPSHPSQPGQNAHSADYVSGACVLMRKAAFDEVGGFDDSFFMYAEEVDLCYRLHQKDWQVWHLPEAEVVHVGGGSHSLPSRREADLYQSRVHFFRKHYSWLSAALLALMIYTLGILKFYGHSAIRWISRGQRGREVVAPNTLFLRFRRVL